MKCVSIHLKSDWERESWKLQRLFTAEIQTCEPGEPSDTIILLSLNPDSCQAQSERCGFPSVPISIRLLVSHTYLDGTTPTERSSPLVRIESARLADCEIPIYSAFSKDIACSFDSLFAESTSPRIYNTLKQLERSVLHTWIAGMLRLRASPAPSASQVECMPLVGEFILSGSDGWIPASVKLVPMCLKCERVQFEQSLPVIDGHSFAYSSECSTCTRQLDLSGSPFSSIHGTDCGVSSVTSISAWLTCPLTHTITFVRDLPPNECRSCVFDCGCDAVDVSFEFVSRISKSPIFRPDHKLSNPPRIRVYKEGFALPSNGGCKHHKRSFRWLQYACCEDWFSCDECHDARVTTHECDRQSAVRMMCGFCSKQQVVGEVCDLCSSRLVTPSSPPQVDFKPRFRRNRRR